MSRLRAGKAVLGIILGGAPTLSLALSEADCKEIMVQYGVVAAGCAPVATPVPTVLVPAAIPTAVSRSESQITDPATDRMRESHIFFLQGGSRLQSDDQLQLQKLAKVLETGPMRDACLKLVGHSDSVGSASANLALSQRRAQVVADYLARHLTDASRIEEVVGLGEEQTIPGLTTTARQNRRVEIQARKCPSF